MEIDKNLSIINSAHHKPRSKENLLERDQKITSALHTDSSKEPTLIQLSDYIHLRTKTSRTNKFTPLNDLDAAQEVLDVVKNQASQTLADYTSVQINSHPKTVFYLLG